MDDCAFCDIAARHAELPWVLDHGEVVSFKPLGTGTVGHRMFVPKRHVRDAASDPALTGRCFHHAAIWAATHGPDFNLVVNVGPNGDQTVFHLHVHYVPREAGDGLGYRWAREETS